jgi:hypothetical protein
LSANFIASWKAVVWTILGVLDTAVASEPADLIDLVDLTDVADLTVRSDAAEVVEVILEIVEGARLELG